MLDDILASIPAFKTPPRLARVQALMDGNVAFFRNSALPSDRFLAKLAEAFDPTVRSAIVDNLMAPVREMASGSRVFHRFCLDIEALPVLLCETTATMTVGAFDALVDVVNDTQSGPDFDGAAYAVGPARFSVAIERLSTAFEKGAENIQQGRATLPGVIFAEVFFALNEATDPDAVALGPIATYAASTWVSMLVDAGQR